MSDTRLLEETPSRRIGVLVVEDDVAARFGLEVFLSHADGIELMGIATNGEQAVRMCGQLGPDVVLMDVQMPMMDGITATRLIRAQYPTMQVIMLSMLDDKERVDGALEAGAFAYLSKYDIFRKLIPCIRAAGALAAGLSLQTQTLP